MMNLAPLIIVFAPLLGFALVGLGGIGMFYHQPHFSKRTSELITTFLVSISAVFSWLMFWKVCFSESRTLPAVFLAPWLEVGNLSAHWTVTIDSLAAVMCVVVTTVSALVHWYSIGYMHDDGSRPRFFAYLSLFTFAMLMLVTSDNLLQMFFGWEGVGLASYLLIGFWYDKASANAASIKAFVVNRVGDFGFIIGMWFLYSTYHTLEFKSLFSEAESLMQHSGSITFFNAAFSIETLHIMACAALFVGVMGKSAQFLLHTWLPDAMEGPTPVSALIHAATMVTAGVFMLGRLSPLYALAPSVLFWIAIIGSFTALFAATVAVVQTDIKRVIAYSTCSQLGYMVAAMGLGATGAGIFHLFTHAFFKALLFLGAGSVIHALHHEQNMEKMGALRAYIPWTAGAMIIGTLALVGFPGTAGFYSKDAIINTAFRSHTASSFVSWSLLLTAALTSFYSWRLYFMTFEGHARWKEDPHESHHIHDAPPHESPWVMLIPLGLLTFGALVSGILFAPYFIGSESLDFWNGALHPWGFSNTNAMGHGPQWLHFVLLSLPFIGFGLALWFYQLNPSLPQSYQNMLPWLYNFLWRKWYIDELYDALFIRPITRLSRWLWKTGDGTLIDRGIIDSCAQGIQNTAAYVRKFYTGSLNTYAGGLTAGVIISFALAAFSYF
jgi:NADH-quinone oxidoreductase subunit L